jgi:transcription-repair coupling factor (superfamily II helicase)
VRPADAAEENAVPLDKLGGVAWQSRKARLKQRIRDIADQLIKVAAARMLKQAPVMEVSRVGCSGFVRRGGRIPAPVTALRN